MKRYQSIKVEPMTVHIGAKIAGVDLTRPLPEHQKEEIWWALLVLCPG